MPHKHSWRQNAPVAYPLVVSVAPSRLVMGFVRSEERNFGLERRNLNCKCAHVLVHLSLCGFSSVTLVFSLQNKGNATS